MLFSASRTYFVIALIAAAASYVMAHRKGLNAPGWAWGSLFFVFPVVILPFVRSRRALPPPELDDRWQSLSIYDPEIKAAISQLTPLGLPAIEDLRPSAAQRGPSEHCCRYRAPLGDLCKRRLDARGNQGRG